MLRHLQNKPIQIISIHLYISCIIYFFDISFLRTETYSVETLPTLGLQLLYLRIILKQFINIINLFSHYSTFSSSGLLSNFIFTHAICLMLYTTYFSKSVKLFQRLKLDKFFVQLPMSEWWENIACRFVPQIDVSESSKKQNDKVQ